MPKYRVISPLGCDGRNYEPGDVIELKAEQAEAMPWAVEPLPEPKVAPAPPAPEEKPKGKK